MTNYKIAETETFAKKIKTNKYRALYQKITDYVYPILRENPHYGPHIKKLKGEFKDLHRFRIGDFRLFYKIADKTVVVFILDIESRKDAY